MVGALHALRAGDLDALRAELDRDPSLVAARVPSTEPPYDGFFHGATLLHHVSGNPEVLPVPPSAPDLARLLLERGAEIDARSGQGPRQPAAWWTWTTLGLVASSTTAVQAGVADELVDVLLGAGADLEEADGRPLYAAVCHASTTNGLRDLARGLYARGARVDLGTAAAVADLDTVRGLVEARDARVRYRYEDDRVDGWEAVLDEAAVWAAAFDRPDVLALLLDAGASGTRWVSLHGSPTSALHRAAVCGAARAAALLVEAGADPRRGDPEHDTPAWRMAEYGGFPALAATLRGD